MVAVAMRTSDRLVLCYHAVSERWPATLAVTPARLEEQLFFLARRGYAARTFSAALEQPDAGRALAVTFDDAYRSVFEQAFPVLRALHMPATVFVPTDLVATGAPMRWPGIEQWLGGPHAHELIGMSWEQLGELAQAGWEIGSHTRTHARLTDLHGSALADELRGSREHCEQRLGRPCPTLAYPYGAVDARVVRAAGEAGYAAACAPPNRLPGDRRLRWPRVGVYPADDLRRFRVKVSPHVRWLMESPAGAPLGRLARRV
jgi:peptidoglycan/xylan/chitin deacetylase (PgdA/CDA1 family)